MKGEIDLTEEQRQLVVGLIKRHLPDTDVWAYGSRVTWTARPESDLDLVVFSGPDQSGLVSDLREALTESDLPFRVDVLVWDELPKSFRDRMDCNHVKLLTTSLRFFTRYLAIGNVATIVGGGTPSTRDPSNFRGSVPWLTPRDLSPPHPRYVSHGERYLSEKGLASCSACLVPAGAVLLSTRAPIGYTAIAANPLATNQGFRCLIPKDNILSEYLYYWLTANTSELDCLGSGSTFRELSGRLLSDIIIPVPPLAVQRRIVDVLGTIDDKLDANQKLICTIDNRLQVIFRALSNNVECQRSVRLGDVMAINPSRFLRNGDQAPYVDMASMPTIGHSPLPIRKRQYRHGTRFTNGDTLVARITPCLENGKTAYVDFLPSDTIGWGSTEFIVLRPKRSIPNEFAYCVARSTSFRNYAIANMTGSSGRQRVSAGVLAEYEFLLPPQHTLDDFGDVARLCTSRARSAILESSMLSEVRDVMLSATLSRTNAGKECLSLLQIPTLF